MRESNILKTGLVFLITVVLYILMQIGAAFLIPQSFMDGAGYYVVVTLFEVLWFGVPALIYLFTRKPRIRIFGGRVSIEQIVLSVFIGITAYYVLNYVQIIWQLLLMLFGYTPVTPEIPFIEGIGGFALMAASIAVIPAFFEELMFRGLLFGSLRREKKLLGAMIISSVLFMLMHGMVESLPYTFLAGILLAFLAYRSSSLWPGIVMHFTFNLTSVGLMYLTNTSDFFAQQTMPDLSDTHIYMLSALTAAPVATIAAGLCALMIFLFTKVSRPAAQMELRPARSPWAIKWLPILISVFLLCLFVFFTFFLTLVTGAM